MTGEHCGHECVCDDFHPEYDPDYQEVCNNKDCPHDTRSSSHAAGPTVPIMPMLLRSCFGDFDDCPCGDECVVSEYCAKYQKDTPNHCGLTDSQCYEVQEHEKKQVRQQAAAEERKKVLDAIARWVESHRCYRDDGSLEWTYGLHADELDKIIEYLRREGEQR